MRRLRLSPTLTKYIARQFFFNFAGFLFAIVGIIFLATVVDLIDRLATKDVSLAVTLEMALLKLPHLSQEVMPFTILFATMTTFWRLTRSHELVVARAAGVSVWQFLLPVLGGALIVGFLTVTALNPLASILLSRFERLEANYVHNETSFLAVSKTGLWLRQADRGGQSVIHASRVSPGSVLLHDVIVFRYADTDRFVDRIDAERAQLRDRHWQLYKAWVSKPGEASAFYEEFDLPTELTVDKIQESFAPPETIAFWNLPEFIEIMDAAGFSALPHRLQLHRLLALPMLFAAMVLLAATFSMRTQRRGRVGVVIMAGLLTGFLLYFLSNFVFAIGLSGTIPVVLAAWTPAGVSLMLGVAMLLHLEDG
ncbi:LPS export ABC transporter permease LptG [Pelagibius litoralis]|uniref:LPS export ABC transporter permease LptG n=2 Tax=Pelagibius litoralis TaxID=374515 RepID=A0A967EZF1_9PROT|nr:LPS export ABC transporter permease LptG [Pelagibius litoralis]